MADSASDSEPATAAAAVDAATGPASAPAPAPAITLVGLDSVQIKELVATAVVRADAENKNPSPQSQDTVVCEGKVAELMVYLGTLRTKEAVKDCHLVCPRCLRVKTTKAGMEYHLKQRVCLNKPEIFGSSAVKLTCPVCAEAGFVSAALLTRHFHQTHGCGAHSGAHVAEAGDGASADGAQHERGESSSAADGALGEKRKRSATNRFVDQFVSVATIKPGKSGGGGQAHSKRAAARGVAPVAPAASTSARRVDKPHSDAVKSTAAAAVSAVAKKQHDRMELDEFGCIIANGALLRYAKESRLRSAKSGLAEASATSSASSISAPAAATTGTTAATTTPISWSDVLARAFRDSSETNINSDTAAVSSGSEEPPLRVPSDLFQMYIQFHAAASAAAASSDDAAPVSPRAEALSGLLAEAAYAVSLPAAAAVDWTRRLVVEGLYDADVGSSSMFCSRPGTAAVRSVPSEGGATASTTAAVGIDPDLHLLSDLDGMHQHGGSHSSVDTVAAPETTRTTATPASHSIDALVQSSSLPPILPVRGVACRVAPSGVPVLAMDLTLETDDRQAVSGVAAWVAVAAAAPDINGGSRLSVIQIWSISLPPFSDNVGFRDPSAALAMCIGVDGGRVRDMEWCPTLDPEDDRLGVLAVLTDTDGCVRVYAVPRPTQQQQLHALPAPSALPQQQQQRGCAAPPPVRFLTPHIVIPPAQSGSGISRNNDSADSHRPLSPPSSSSTSSLLPTCIRWSLGGPGRLAVGFSGGAVSLFDFSLCVGEVAGSEIVASTQNQSVTASSAASSPHPPRSFSVLQRLQSRVPLPAYQLLDAASECTPALLGLPSSSSSSSSRGSSSYTPGIGYGNTTTNNNHITTRVPVLIASPCATFLSRLSRSADTPAGLSSSAASLFRAAVGGGNDADDGGSIRSIAWSPSHPDCLAALHCDGSWEVWDAAGSSGGANKNISSSSNGISGIGGAYGAMLSYSRTASSNFSSTGSSSAISGGRGRAAAVASTAAAVNSALPQSGAAAGPYRCGRLQSTLSSIPLARSRAPPPRLVVQPQLQQGSASGASSSTAGAEDDVIASVTAAAAHSVSMGDGGFGADADAIAVAAAAYPSLARRGCSIDWSPDGLGLLVADEGGCLSYFPLVDEPMRIAKNAGGCRFWGSNSGAGSAATAGGAAAAASIPSDNRAYQLQQQQQQCANAGCNCQFCMVLVDGSSIGADAACGDMGASTHGVLYPRAVSASSSASSSAADAMPFDSEIAAADSAAPAAAITQQQQQLRQVRNCPLPASLLPAPLWAVTSLPVPPGDMEPPPGTLALRQRRRGYDSDDEDEGDASSLLQLPPPANFMGLPYGLVAFAGGDGSAFLVPWLPPLEMAALLHLLQTQTSTRQSTSEGRVTDAADADFDTGGKRSRSAPHPGSGEKGASSSSEVEVMGVRDARRLACMLLPPRLRAPNALSLGLVDAQLRIRLAYMELPPQLLSAGLSGHPSSASGAPAPAASSAPIPDPRPLALALVSNGNGAFTATFVDVGTEFAPHHAWTSRVVRAAGIKGS